MVGMVCMMKTKIPASKYILDISKDYSLYVCQNRAVPSVTDGLKSSQRKALWLMRNKPSKIKTVSLSGEMLSSGLYVHGDTSASEAISNMAAPYRNNKCLLYGIGTFGTRISPSSWAAPRYTYVKKSKFAEKVLYVDLDIIPLCDNYDGSIKEPETFLPLIPLVLLNGISGIAIGWSTEILPRNWKDLLDATIKVLDGINIRRIKPGYSYLNIDVKHLEDNVWEFSGKAEIPSTSTIKITELPPDLSLEKFKDRLNIMENDGQIRNYVDQSTETINVVINMPRGFVSGWKETKAVDFFKLRQKKIERLVVIDWDGKAIRQYDRAEDLIKDFVAWRLGFYTNRYQKLLDDATDKIKFWKGVKLCFDKKLPQALGNIASKKAIEKKIATITKTLKLEQKHIDRILNLATYRWATEYYKVVVQEIKELDANIKSYQSYLKSPKKIKAKYRQELVDLKKI